MSVTELLSNRIKWHIEEGNNRDILRSLPEKSIQMVVTSPPYWSLRKYNVPDTIWGGLEGCEHTFIEKSRYWDNRHGAALSQEGYLELGSIVDHRGYLTSLTCEKCNAWYGQLGLEPTPELFIEHLVAVFREIKRVIRDDGIIWINMGDSYSGSGRGADAKYGDHAIVGESQAIKPDWGKLNLKPKDLIGVPWMLAFALRNDGWYLRSDIIWQKIAALPESVTDRPTKSHEYIFLLSKQERYFYDQDAIREPLADSTINDRRMGTSGTGRARYSADNMSATPSGFTGANPLGRNKRSVWAISSEPLRDEHYASFPSELPTICIEAGTSEKGCCPHCGTSWIRSYNKEPVPQDIKGKMTVLWRREHPPKFLGWQQNCKCEPHEPIPSIVLDPFSGSGRTGIAALRLNRRYLGCELSSEYAEMSRKLIYNDCPLLNMELV